jgi:hypothetical protein
MYVILTAELDVDEVDLRCITANSSAVVRRLQATYASSTPNGKNVVAGSYHAAIGMSLLSRESERNSKHDHYSAGTGRPMA